MLFALGSSCAVDDVASDSVGSATTGGVDVGGEGAETTATTGSSASDGAIGTSAGETFHSDTTMAGTDDDDTTGDPAECEDSLVQSELGFVVNFGDWPPTGTDALGDDAWDIEVACAYVGPSPVLTGIILVCDDAGVEREVDLQYSLQPEGPSGPLDLPPMKAGEPLLLRVHTGFREAWLILSSSAGKILLLGIAGSPEATLTEQSEYSPFEFELQNSLCPVEGCVRQLGLDIRVAGVATRVFQGLPVDIVGENDAPYVVIVEALFEHVASIDPSCDAQEVVHLAILARE